MRHLSLPMAALVLVVLSMGVAHGLLTDRWGASASLQTAVAALDRVPTAVGDWTGEAVEYNADDLARAGIRGWAGRTYRHAGTGQSVSVLIVCGRGGPICVHTPDVCYAGAGYRPTRPPERATPVDGTGFWYGRFGKPDAVVPQRLDIYWAWSRDGVAWSAPDNPRSAFAWSPALYKLYVVRTVPPTGESSDPELEAFLARFLPVVKSALAP